MSTTRARKESAFHLSLLVLVQWIGLAVVILNATALFLLRGSQQQLGLVNTYSSPADYMLLILGSLSFFGSSVLLLLHLHIHFRLLDDCPFIPPRGLSATEVIVSVISIALWTVATSLILTRSQDAASPCKFTNSLYTRNHSAICELFDTTLMLAFAAVGSWVLVLLATLFILIRSPIPPTTIFTIEAPPQRFSQPMNVSLPDEIYLQSSQHDLTRPYYLGHHHNKVRPLDDHDILPQLIVTVDKEVVNDSSINDSLPSSTGRQTILMLQDQQQDNSTRHSCYQPQYNLALSSTTSFNNNSLLTDESTTSSYYSSRLPIVESQRTIKSLSTIDSIGHSHHHHQPMQFDLPIIKLGHISHMDTSFLEKIQKRE